LVDPAREVGLIAVLHRVVGQVDARCLREIQPRQLDVPLSNSVDRRL
jgi:hypothetical protein